MATNNKDLAYYLDRFAHMHCYKDGDVVAPHKAVCLMTVMTLLSSGRITDNDILPDDTFVEQFRRIWRAYVPPVLPLMPTWENPFKHLEYEGFWHLTTELSGTSVADLLAGSVSAAKLRQGRIHAQLDPELFALMHDLVAHRALMEQLRQSYLSWDTALIEHYTQQEELEQAAEPAASLTRSRTSHTDCPFCHQGSLTTLFATDWSIAFFDTYPVSPGHTLIVPKRHVSSYFNLSLDEKEDLWYSADRAKEILDERYRPDGYNLGFNIGEAAGQSIFHVHLHVIPRYRGDTPHPKGGIRGVIPDKQNY